MDTMDTGVVGRVRAFDDEHGDSIQYEGWIFYSDGAARETNPQGVLKSPPTDPWELAKKIASFRELVYAYAADKFRTAKQQAGANLRGALSYQGRCGAPPDAQVAVAELEELRDAARSARDKFTAAQKAVEAAKPDHLKAREDQDAGHRQATEKLLGDIDRIEI